MGDVFIMHPASGSYTFTIDKPYAAVKVERKGKTLKLLPGEVFIAKEDTRYTELPKEYKLLTPDGEEIVPHGKFLISTETLDPFHIVLDYFEHT